MDPHGAELAPDRMIAVPRVSGPGIDGLPADTYVVHAERLDGPVFPANIAAVREGFGESETTGYDTN